MCLKHFETTHGIVFIWKLPWISDGYINDFWNRIYLLTGTSKFPKGNHPKIGPQIRFGNHDVWYAKRWCVDEAHWKLGKYAVRRLVFSWQSWGILNHHLLVFLPVDPPFELGCNRKSLGCHWGVAGPSKCVFWVLNFLSGSWNLRFLALFHGWLVDICWHMLTWLTWSRGCPSVWRTWQERMSTPMPRMRITL